MNKSFLQYGNLERENIIDLSLGNKSQEEKMTEVNNLQLFPK
jgi:hypothetical protein